MTKYRIFQESDYVYLLKESTAAGQKFKNKFAGPYVISKVISPHMYSLKDPITNKIFAQPFHVNRLKPAYMRVSNPLKSFIDSVRTQEVAEVRTPDIEENESDNESDQLEDDNQNDSNVPDDLPQNDEEQSISDNIRSEINGQTDNTVNDTNIRPKRKKQLPARFRDDNFVLNSDVDISEDSRNMPNVKRFLAQKTVNGKTSYLAHMVGEPAQHAVWLELHQLGPKAKAKLKSRPPPPV